MKIPFYKPFIGKEEEDAVLDVLRSGWLTVGDKVRQFEDDLREYLGAGEVVAVDSCTSALTIVLDELYNNLVWETPAPTVAIPALTFVATANAAFRAGFNIEFVDVDETGNINPYLIPDFVDAVVPVHFAGQPVDIDAINKIGVKHIVYDSAHALGTKYKGGSIATNNINCFSFYPTKNITTIEGGAISTPKSWIADRARSLSLHGLAGDHVNRFKRDSVVKPTVVNRPGYKANMTNVEAAIGIEQLKKVDVILRKKKIIASNYMYELPFVETLGFSCNIFDEHSWHMYVILVDNRDEIVSKLRNAGIGVGIHYSPIIPEHKFYHDYYLDEYKREFPVAKTISERCISLPIYPSLSELEQEYIIEKVKELV